MITLFFQAALIILVLVTLLWIWSVFIKNVSIVDIFWGFGFVIVNAFYVFMSGELNPRKIIEYDLEKNIKKFKGEFDIVTNIGVSNYVKNYIFKKLRMKGWRNKCHNVLGMLI